MEIRFFYSSAGGDARLGQDFNLLDELGGRGYRLTMQAHAFDVELDGLADQLLHLVQRSASDAEAWKIGGTIAPSRVTASAWMARVPGRSSDGSLMGSES